MKFWWTPRVLTRAQAGLLFSAFLAMLGKQWLNRYASTDLQGTAIERSQNRQRKLDGVVAWYFDQVMASLSLMLQVALLLLGCALSRYLWETVTSVILGLTSLVSPSTFSSWPLAQLLRVARIKRLDLHVIRYLTRRVLSSATPGSDSQTAMLDFRCISWMLQASLDKAVHLSTLKHCILLRVRISDPIHSSSS